MPIPVIVPKFFVTSRPCCWNSSSCQCRQAQGQQDLEDNEGCQEYDKDKDTNHNFDDVLVLVQNDILSERPSVIDNNDKVERDKEEDDHYDDKYHDSHHNDRHISDGNGNDSNHIQVQLLKSQKEEDYENQRQQNQKERYQEQQLGRRNSIPMKCLALEEILERYVFEMCDAQDGIHQTDESEDLRPAVYYPPVPEISWLACQQKRLLSPTKETEFFPTLTGIYEYYAPDCDHSLCSPTPSHSLENEASLPSVTFPSTVMQSTSLRDECNEHKGHSMDEIDVNLSITLWTAETDQQQIATAASTIKSPNTFSNDNSHDWIRRPLHYLPPSISSQVYKDYVQVRWIDLRNVTSGNISPTSPSSVYLTTNASCVYFLQAILDSSNPVSPWLSSFVKNDDKKDLIQQQQQQQQSPSSDKPVDVVIVLVSGRAPELLVKFRVSDVCPSWYFHSSTILRLPKTESTATSQTTSKTTKFTKSKDDCDNNDNHNLQWKQEQQQQQQQQQQKQVDTFNSDCNIHSKSVNNTPWYPWTDRSFTLESDHTCEIVEMLVYHRLPPRERLSSVHPITRQPAPVAGCLWETFYDKSSDSMDKGGIYMKLNTSNENGINDATNTLTETTTSNFTSPTPTTKYQLSSPPFIDYISEYHHHPSIVNNNSNKERATTTKFPNLLELLNPTNLKLIQDEVKRIPQWTAWPEQVHYSGSIANEDGIAPWNVFPLCYCFPANDETKRKWIPLTSSFVPHTVRLLKKHAGSHLRTALFSKLNPDSVLQTHTGWEDLANHVYRIHIPIQMPVMSSSAQDLLHDDYNNVLCGVWVDGCVMTYNNTNRSTSNNNYDSFPYRLVTFDDSKNHRAYNYSSHERIVLIVDLARPPHLPLGTAVGGHTEELDQFIEQFGGVSD